MLQALKEIKYKIFLLSFFFKLIRDNFLQEQVCLPLPAPGNNKMKVLCYGQLSQNIHNDSGLQKILKKLYFPCIINLIALSLNLISYQTFSQRKASVLVRYRDFTRSSSLTCH